MKNTAEKIKQIALSGGIFKAIPYAMWEQVPATVKQKEDIDEPVQYRASGEIPAEWLLCQLGLTGFSIGSAKLSEENANMLASGESVDIDHLVQLISLVKMRIRNAVGILLVENEPLF